MQKEMKGVVGFAMDVKRVDASYKLSQNRNKRSCPPSLRMIQYRPLDRLLKQLLGTRLMAGRLSLEQSVVVRIHCPQHEKTLASGSFYFQNQARIIMDDGDEADPEYLQKIQLLISLNNIYYRT